MLHELGAHYTYAEVPYDAWFEKLTGRGLNDWFGFHRNHFDRLVHFSYGLLFAYPMREIFVRIANARGFWGYFLPLEMVMSTSMLYELIEWGAASTVGKDLGQAYLGTQGDEWDSQKDMLLATMGAVVALVVAASIHRAYNRDFQREWAESLSVSKKEPLGEQALAKLKRGR
jgi:putative membrane protein